MERTLFVFEGEKCENQYFQSLKHAFFGDNESHILVSFQNDLYALYQQLSADEDLDAFELIRELNPTIQNQENLATLRREQVSQIYLFFDMEPQDDLYSDAKLLSMLQLFDNETERGKLFVSYPMVEAIRDIDSPDKFLTLTADLQDCKGKTYKRLSAERGNLAYQDARKIDKSAWKVLISANLMKANYLVSGAANQPPTINQSDIAIAQLKDYLPQKKIAILSAFPLFLSDYFGHAVFER